MSLDSDDSDSEQISILHWVSTDSHKCGYCGSSNSISHGLWAECLAVEDYQNMIDRGWRRSGKYCYKPIMNEICCPQYTIRCAALNFKPTKSQKKVLKKVNKYLRDGLPVTAANTVSDKGEAMEGSQQAFAKPSHVKEVGSRIKAGFATTTTKPATTSQAGTASQTQSTSKTSATSAAKVKEVDVEVKPKVKKGVGADSARPLCQKAKFLRQKRREAKLLQAATTPSKSKAKLNQNQEKTLGDLIHEQSMDCMHNIQVKLICPTSRDWPQHRQVEFELYKKYQMSVHNDPPEKCSVNSFEHFLVHTPLQSSVVGNGSVLGSFHQQYWLDNKLIAVGVIDILPKCVSSVYFFYDPDYRELTLGTYSALREVEFTQSLHAKHPSIEYYYMGFYIHTCPKMRYKGKFSPSDLLCPETYAWTPITQCIALLDASKYARLQGSDARDVELCPEGPLLDELKIIVDNSMYKVGQYNRRRQHAQTFATLGRLLGKKLIRSVYIVLE